MDYLRVMKQGKQEKEEPSLLAFTPREREIISAILTGSMNKDIAARLSITEDTVKRHLSNIFAKARVSNRLELAIWSTNKGFL